MFNDIYLHLKYLIMNIKWKQISFDRYQQLTNGMTDVEIVLNGDTSKNFKQEFLWNDIPKGIGMLESMELIDKRIIDAIEPDDFEYFENDGTEYVIMGSEKTINAIEEAIENNI